jgi:GNAT superfamily N-acetyltransferase
MAAAGPSRDELVLRPCSHEPLELLQEFHDSVFPIRFEPAFFSHLSAGRFQTLGAYLGGALDGMAVWDMVPSGRADRRDGPLFSRLIGRGVRADGCALYIMTLGVRAGQRGKGLGRALLEAFLQPLHAHLACRLPLAPLASVLVECRRSPCLEDRVRKRTRQRARLRVGPAPHDGRLGNRRYRRQQWPPSRSRHRLQQRRIRGCIRCPLARRLSPLRLRT